MKKKLLYLMNVSWGVIKQRQHFVAENLAKNFDVTVYSVKKYRTSHTVSNETEANLDLKQLFVLPFGRFKLITKINAKLVEFQLSQAVAKADIVWVSHPIMYEAVNKSLPENTKLIYDCLDDALEFPNVCADEALKEQFFEQERALVNRSNVVFSTAEYLKGKLIHRYDCKTEITVVNNAIAIPEKAQSNDSDDIARLKILMDSIAGKKLLYLGAISEWMDFDLILSSVERVPGITYVFVGPCYGVPVPRHERIIIFGPIEHRNIFRAMNMADALIMPFRINELIKSVDPVKIYDYIYSCKPTVVVGYGETEKFENFIHLYRTPAEYVAKLEMLIVGKLQSKKSSDVCLNFALQNTWPVRVEQMLPVINALE